MWARSHASGLISGECWASTSASDSAATRSSVRSRASARPSMTASVVATPTVTLNTLSTPVGVLVPSFVTGHHEPPSRMQDLGAELALQVLGGEVALVDPMPGAVVERPLLDALGRAALPQRAVHHDELGRHATRLGQETLPLRTGQMAVEVAGQHAVEGAVGEGKVERVAPHDDPVRQSLLRNRHHRGARIETDNEALEVAGQETGSAGDVERSRRGQGGDEGDDTVDLGVPAGAVARRELALALVPLVVFARPGVVVGLGARVAREAGHAALGSFRDTTFDTPSSPIETP